jgi:hypothetical protein
MHATSGGYRSCFILAKNQRQGKENFKPAGFSRIESSTIQPRFFTAKIRVLEIAVDLTRTDAYIYKPLRMDFVKQAICPLG